MSAHVRSAGAAAIVLGSLIVAALSGASAEPAASATASSAPSRTSPVREAPGHAAAAAELPHLQPGLWRYRRTVMKAGGKPEVTTTQHCGDPTAEFRSKMAELEKKGCRFFPTERKDAQYVSRWTCETPAGLLKFRDVLIAQSETAYQTLTESHAGERLTRSTIDAVRVSDCPKAEKAPPRP